MRIWLHAASVGEIEAVRPIALGLLEQRARSRLVITTMTATGCEAASRRIPGATACWLAPLDHPLTVRAFLATVAPHLVVISEAELWPNYFIESRRAGAQVALVNGRVSVRSLSRYRLMRSLWAKALRCADRLLVQSQHDADRYLALGAPPDRIVISGNTKFTPLDSGNVGRTGSRAPAFCHRGRHPHRRFDGAAGGRTGTRRISRLLRQRFAGLRLVLAPRHLERVGEIEEMLGRKGLSYIKATRAQSGSGARRSQGLAARYPGRLALTLRLRQAGFRRRKPLRGTRRAKSWRARRGGDCGVVRPVL